MRDRYGVPDSFFGRVDEDFYGLLGCVVMLSTLLEDKLLVLAWALDDQPQEVLAGRHTQQLFKVCRDRLPHYARELSRTGLRLLDGTEEALRQRHALVHSLWPSATAASAKGWRNLPQRRRAEHGQPVAWTHTSASELQDLVDTLVQLIEEHDQLRMRLPQGSP